MKSIYSRTETFRRYTWAANRISEETMNELYRIKQKSGKKITEQVKEAVERYVKAQKKGG